jgi:micrococcal nuclease
VNRFLVALFLVFFLGCQYNTRESRAKVIGIKDGDTIEILNIDNTTEVVRLLDIDCPEKGQPFEKAGKQFCADLCFGKQVKIVRKTKDRYGRILGTVYVDNKLCVNKALVQAGLAWHFKKYSQKEEYAVLENEARGKKVGLWQDAAPIAPWDWRKSGERDLSTK